MKILQIFGWVVAVHLVAFIAIFASPGCQSGPRNIPTPDATVPSGGSASNPVSFTIPAAQPADLGTPPPSSSAHATPTRPGSANAVAVTPPKPAAEVITTSTYIVQSGDSLWSIAKKNGMTVAELAKLNGVPASAALKPGKHLLIPVKGVAAAPAADKPRDLGTLTQAPAPKPAGEVTRHTVAVGESLGVIAKKHQVSLGELAAANNITDPSKVKAGQVLLIPGSRAVKSPTAATPAPKAATPATTTPAPTTAASDIPSVGSTPPPASATPRFEITAPPPGQDLDAGLKETSTEVPTIKVEDPKPETPKL
jgi:LysM repeat protein